MMPRYAFLTVALVVGAWQPANPQAVTPVAFTNATVIDVEAGRPVPGMTVVVRDGRIIAVSNESFQPPRGARIIDATGRRSRFRSCGAGALPRPTGTR